MVQTFNGDYLTGDKMKTDLVTKDLTTTSLALAELFGKNHKDVLRVVRNVISDMSEDDLAGRKIALSSSVANYTAQLTSDNTDLFLEA